MATPKPVTEPAAPAAGVHVTEPALPAAGETRVYDSRRKVRVYDKNTKQVVSRLVPETWLDGRFPNLVEAPSSKKAGK